MDESWRMKMGVSAASVRPSSLEPEDFDDVFGGPPKSVLARKLSADFTCNDWFYSEIFKPLELDTSGVVSGRRLPEFVIPQKRMSKNKQMKTISRSKSTSSSIMSLDELYQLSSFGSSTVIGEEDVALSTFSSKLRPINIPKANNNRKQDIPAFGCPNTTHVKEKKLFENESKDYNNKIRGFINNKFEYSQTVTSPNTFSTEQTTFNISVNSRCDMKLSPPSPVSSLCRGLKNSQLTNFNYHEYMTPYDDLQVQDEATSSHGRNHNNVNPSRQQLDVNNANAIDIDEAIAWAKEKFQGWSSNDQGAILREQGGTFFA